MRRFNSHIEAEKLRQRKRDTENWLLGMYIQSAVGTAVEHCLVGRKARSKYIDKPFSQRITEESKHTLTDSELQKQRELFVAKLKIMQANFEITHPKKTKRQIDGSDSLCQKQ